MRKNVVPRSDFSRNVLTLISGTSVAQVIPLAAAPLLSRLYAPGDFGALASLVSVVSALAVVSSLRYEVAIVLPDDDRKAADLVSLSFLVLAGVALAAWPVTVAVTAVAGTGPVSLPWRWFVPLAVFLLGAGQILNHTANRLQRYRAVAGSRVGGALMTVGLQLALGYAALHAAGLVAGYLAGLAVAVAWLFLRLRPRLARAWRRPARDDLAAVARTYEVFPRVNSLLALSDMFQVNGIVYFLMAFFSQAVVGLYALAARVLQAPMNLVGAAMAQVYYQQASRLAGRPAELQALTHRTLVRSAWIGAPVLVALLAAGPGLFAFVFGDPWRTAGEYARVLAPWIFFDFLRSPVSQLSLVLNKQKRLFRLTLVGNGLLVISFFCGAWLQDAWMGFLIFSVLQSLWSLVILRWIYTLAGEYESR